MYKLIFNVYAHTLIHKITIYNNKLLYPIQYVNNIYNGKLVIIFIKIIYKKFTCHIFIIELQHQI